jgi:hypothetical protein
LYRTDAEIEELVKQAQAIAIDGGQMVFDITMPSGFGDAADTMIWDIAGEAPEKALYIERVLHRVIHAGLEKVVKVTGGTEDLRELFILKGYEVLPQAATVVELLGQTGLVSVTQDMLNTMGEGFIDKMKKNGLFQGQLTTGSKPPAYAALQILGE